MTKIENFYGSLFGNVGKIEVHNHASTSPQPQPQTNPATQHAQHAEEVEEIVEDKPIPSFFRTNAQSITKIEQKWQEALGKTTKTGVIRFVKSHDSSTGYFKLAGYTNEQLAEEFNKAQTKYKFTENDFENANKPLKK